MGEVLGEDESPGAACGGRRLHTVDHRRPPPKLRLQRC